MSRSLFFQIYERRTIFPQYNIYAHEHIHEVKCTGICDNVDKKFFYVKKRIVKKFTENKYFKIK